MLLDTATDWLPDDLQAPDTSLSLSAPASRVVTTGAFPVTSQGPANFQTGLSVQQQRSGYQPAQQPVSSQHADMLQQPGIRHSAMQPQGHMPSYMQPTAAQPQSNAQAPDEILSTVEEALERAGNVPPDVKAQLMEYMAATTRQQAATARGQAARANPCSLDSQPSWMPEQFVSGPTATDHIPSNSSLLNGYVQPNLSNERNLPAGTAWDMNSDLQHAPFGMQQPQAVQGSSAPSARFSAAQPSLQMPHPPAISTHMGQSFQGMPTDPQISQKQPPYQALLQSGSLPRSGPALAARSAHDMLLQRDSLQSVQHQAQAQSLQNQAQTINHRQQPVTAAQANGFAPSRTSQQMPQSASVAATADAQASGSASLFDAWNLPHLASPQQLPMTSGSPVGSANMHSDPFSAGIGSQAQMHSALMAPLLDPRRSLSPQTSQGLGPVQASLPAALPALTREQLFAARQAQQVHHSQPAQHAQPAQRAQQAVPRAGLHNQGQVPLGHPQAAPVRAGPPDQPARIPQGVHALPQELLPAMYQSNSQQSSDASCGFGGPAYSSQFLPSAAQASSCSLNPSTPTRTTKTLPMLSTNCYVPVIFCLGGSALLALRV